MNIKINDKSHFVTPVSGLIAESFIKIFVEKELYDLKQYISLFVDLPLSELMDAKFEGHSVKLIHEKIYDLDIEDVLKNTPKTFTFDNQTYIVDEMSLDTFGKNYLFDLYHDSFKDRKSNIFEIGIYCLACHLSNSYDMTVVDGIAKELLKMHWHKVIPASFFLLKKSLKKRNASWRLSIAFIVESKRMKLLSKYRTSQFSSSQKNLLAKRWLNY